MDRSTRQVALLTLCPAGYSLFPVLLGVDHSHVRPFHITDITMWTDLSEHRDSELDQFDAVYIGGGNTFALLAELRKSGFEHVLPEYVRRGKAIYGGSAGAVVLGRDIRTVTYLDRNEIGLVETKGLDLAQGYAIWVHYQPQDDNLIETYVRQYQQPVIALSERSGIVIEQDHLRTVGFEPAYRFDEQGKIEIGKDAHHVSTVEFGYVSQPHAFLDCYLALACCIGAPRSRGMEHPPVGATQLC